MQTAKNCIGSSVCTLLSTACSVSFPSPFQTHVEKAGGRHSDIHESFVCTASVSLFCDYLANTLIFAFFFAGKQHVNLRELASLHCTVTMPFHVLTSCWGRLDCRYDVPIQTNCQKKKKLPLVYLHFACGKVTNGLCQQRSVKSKGMNHEIFMTSYPEQSLKQSPSQSVTLWWEMHDT